MYPIPHAADYALRAVVFLARQPGVPATADAVAEAVGAPRNYLRKVLHTLARAEVLSSKRGPHGGFVLSKRQSKLKLARVIEPFMPAAELHSWIVSGMSAQLTSFLNTTTVGQLLRMDANNQLLTGGKHG